MDFKNKYKVKSNDNPASNTGFKNGEKSDDPIPKQLKSFELRNPSGLDKDKKKE